VRRELAGGFDRISHCLLGEHGLPDGHQDGGMVVQETFDIFRKLPNGEPIWIKAVNGIEEAKNSLLYLTVTAPGEYFIYDSRNGSILWMLGENNTAAKRS
jgi:hypothetical protein